MSALPAVELSTLLSTHTDAMASGASMRPDDDHRHHVAAVGAVALPGATAAGRAPLGFGGHRGMVPTAPLAASRGRAQTPVRFTGAMRFAIKTSPQDTTWADMLAVWQAADEIELFESAWTFDHFYPIFTEQIDGDCMEGWITADRPRPGHPPPAGRRARDRRRRIATRRCSPTWPPPSTSSPAAGSSSGSARAGTRWRRRPTASTCTRRSPSASTRSTRGARRSSAC